MGVKDDGKKEDSGKKDGVVLKLDMHCEGCAKKLRKYVKKMDGVEDATADHVTNKLTILGNIDPNTIRGRLAEKTNKKVDIISPPVKKDGGGDKKPAEKPDKPAEKPAKETAEKSLKEAPEKPKEEKKSEAPKGSTTVFKIKLHCDDCIQKIRKGVKKIKGVQNVTVDSTNDLVTVTGTADPKKLEQYLKDKFHRDVEIAQPKKEKTAGGGGRGDKKGKEETGGEKKDKASGGGEKKVKASGGGGSEKKDKGVNIDTSGGAGGGGEKKEIGGGSDVTVEVNKMQYYSVYPPAGPSSSYWYGGPGYNQGYVVPGHIPVQQPNYGYVVDQFHAPYPDPNHAPGVFSDENPNGCSVM